MISRKELLRRLFSISESEPKRNRIWLRFRKATVFGCFFLWRDSRSEQT